MSKKDEKFSELVNLQQPEIKNWVIEMDKLLLDGGCTVRPNTNIVDSSSMIAAKPSSNMLEVMRNVRGCGGCAIRNPNFVSCKHGGPYQFAYVSEQFESCRFVGFNFTADNIADRECIKQWVMYELG